MHVGNWPVRFHRKYLTFAPIVDVQSHAYISLLRVPLTRGAPARRIVFDMDRATLVNRVLELRKEIEELDWDGREYMRKRNPSQFERDLQDERIKRLEQIKRKLQQLEKENLQ